MENQQDNQENQQQANQEQKNKSLFLVSSAIHANHGVYKTDERLNQTIETCKSIREKVKNCDIILLDGGTQDVTEEEKEKLAPHIDGFQSYADSLEVQEIQKSRNWDIVKNAIELLIFGCFFEENKNNLANKYDRIFKVSGRYILNDNFDYDFHMNSKQKIIIRGTFTSQFPQAVTGGTTLQYMSRLWSFDSIFSEYMSTLYANMYNHFKHIINKNGYIDIEHLLYEHLPQEQTIVVNKIGVEGNIAPNGMKVSD